MLTHTKIKNNMHWSSLQLVYFHADKKKINGYMQKVTYIAFFLTNSSFGNEMQLSTCYPQKYTF